MITTELLRKHKDRLLEATTNVKGYQKTSSKGKIFSVKQHEREIKNMSNIELHKKFKAVSKLTDPDSMKFARAARNELKRRYDEGSLPFPASDKPYSTKSKKKPGVYTLGTDRSMVRKKSFDIHWQQDDRKAAAKPTSISAFSKAEAENAFRKKWPTTKILKTKIRKK